ncbi:hypothetical protein N7466_010237 [Penicillium verhagenii]|uniref:uncharacterized protein n=1 Tax=Penicillium verhagenii TaxID=1562060 RepID=UPI002545468D|nr:uncharacterized protein N7466_010237 [Penicillium verhagenii]KAJ5919294.1 hypothetical protein N7466_010237 [Penicillium verhagenii]
MVVVGLRFYTRNLQKVAIGIDDYLIIPALLASLGQVALYIYLVKEGGIGYHLVDVMKTPQKLITLEKGLYANEILDFPFTVTPAKLSILLFYLRIFSLRTFRTLAYVVGAIVLGHGVGVLFAAIFQCWPIAYTWDSSIAGTCFNQQAFYRWVSLPNILTDVIILVMPLPYVWKLHTAFGHKLALTGVFLLGSLGTVFSILRMTTFFQENATTDPTWVSVKLGIWTILEGGIIIIAACLPSIWPLISKMLPRKLLRTQTPIRQLPQYGYHGQSASISVGDGFSRLGNDSLEVIKPNGSETSRAVSDRHTDETELISLHI